MGKGLIVVIILALIALVVFGQYISVRNTLVTKNEAVEVCVVAGGYRSATPRRPHPEPGRNGQRVRQAGADGVRRHRQRALALLSARSPSEKIAANNQLDGALGRLLAIAENYPQLKSNENFLRLQDELAGTENRIAVERKRYNDTLQDYNTYVQQFPGERVRGLGRFQAQRCVLQGGRRIARGAQGEFRHSRATTSSAACARQIDGRPIRGPVDAGSRIGLLPFQARCKPTLPLNSAATMRRSRCLGLRRTAVFATTT